MTATLLGVRDELIQDRRHLHAHPELGFEEHETAAYVAQRLRSLGIETRTGVGKTGVVGVIHGAEGGRRIGIRADMDALPLHEDTGLDFASSDDGAMHACGHDTHTAMLAGAAKLLAGRRG
jgi:hippurate hydrolase